MRPSRSESITWATISALRRGLAGNEAVQLAAESAALNLIMWKNMHPEIRRIWKGRVS